MVQGIQRAVVAILLCVSTTALANEPCPRELTTATFWDHLPRTHDQLRNRDPAGKPLIPAFAAAVPLLKAQRWRDAMPSLLDAARTQPPAGSTEAEREAIYQVGEDARNFADLLLSCIRAMPPDQSVTPGPLTISLGWNDGRTAQLP